MKEVKAPIIYRFLNLLVKHRLVLFSGSVILALFLFFGCSVANAEGMSSNVKAYLLDDMDTYFTNWRSYSSQIDTITSQCPFFVRYDVIIGSGNYTMYEFYKYENLGINSVFINNYYYSEGMNESGYGCVFTKDSSLFLPSTGVTAYRFLVSNRTTLYYILSYTCTSTTSSVGAWFPGARFFSGDYSFYLKPVNASVASSSFSVNLSNAISCGNLYVNTARNTYSLVENTAPQYSEDERLKIYKLWSSQYGDSLVLDMTDFRGAYSSAVSDSISNVSVTLTINGVDTEYQLSDSTSAITDNWSSSSTLFNVSTPYSYFTLSDTYNVYVTKVSFTQTRSSAGGSSSESFYITTDFLMQSNSSVISPAAVPTPALVYDDPAKPIDISDREYDFFQQLQSSVSGGDIDFVSSYPVLPSWANVYGLNTFFEDSIDRLHIYLGSTIMGKYLLDSNYDFDLKAFIYDNAHSQFYDVIIIRLDQTDWPAVINASTLPDSQAFYGYVVLYTDSYYLRLDAETQINILQAIQLDANQHVENWTWLVGKMDDFEDKTLQLLNPIYDQEKFIDDKLSSILFAVQNLDIPVYNDADVLSGIASVVDAIDDLAPADTSLIEQKLDSLINFFVANNSTENSSALTYRNWLRGLDDNTNRTVSNFGTLVFDSIHDLFDLFDADYASDDPNAPAHDYIDITSIFINKMNRASLENSGFNKFFRGFFWPDFDPHYQSGTAEGG